MNSDRVYMTFLGVAVFFHSAAVSGTAAAICALMALICWHVSFRLEQKGREIRQRLAHLDEGADADYLFYGPDADHKQAPGTDVPRGE